MGLGFMGGIRLGSGDMISGSLFCGLDGTLGGPVGLAGIRGGIFGGKSLSITGGSRSGTTGADLAVISGTFAAFCDAAISSRSLLVGGRGGRTASPKAGGSLLPGSLSKIDEALVPEEP